MRPFRLRRWVGYVVLGESLGFLLPLAGFALAWSAGLSAWEAWGLQVALGLGEGALLGLAQALALRGTRGAVPVGRWVLVTVLAAGLAWSIGMLPSTLIDSGVGMDLGRSVTWVLVALGAVVLLLSIPTAQWTVLRESLEHAWRWIPVNVLAWTLALTFTLLPSSVVDEATPSAVTGTLFGLGGVAMALTVAVVTGLGLRRLLRSAPPRDV